jgi:GH24 family phage-related lysozyme (muramidase)
MAEFLWPITVLVVFCGMAALVWRALGIAHDLAKLALQGGIVEAAPKPVVAAGKPAVGVVATAKASTPVSVPAPTSGAVVDQGLINFIKKQEGFSAKPYWDYKQWTVGFGTKASGESDVVTEAEAEQRLTAEVTKAEALVEAFTPGAPKGVKQALTDLTYNAGSGWESAGLGTAIKAGDWAKAKEIIPQYNHAGGQVLAGLTARREAEVSWFDNPL